jgi:TRAP-type C4-dicarboxylate transport system substrate-binding protein
MITTNQEIYKALPEFLRECIRKEIELATQEELNNAQKRIEERKSQIVAGVVLNVERMMSMETLQDKMIITVKLDK